MRATYLACEYRKVWFSQAVDYFNGNVVYCDKCISIPYGEDMQQFIIVLHAGIKAKQDNAIYNKQLFLSGGEATVTIDTGVPNDTAFITFKTLDGNEVLSITNLKSVVILMKILRNILPIGAFIEENHLNIASAFIECVKTCTDIDRTQFSTIKSETFVTEEILKKNPLLERHKVQHLLMINKIDFSCIANLIIGVKSLNSFLNASIGFAKNKDPASSTNQELPIASNFGNEKDTNVEELQNTSIVNSNVQQNQMTLKQMTIPIIAVQNPPSYQSYVLVKAVGPTPPISLMQESE